MSRWFTWVATCYAVCLFQCQGADLRVSTDFEGGSAKVESIDQAAGHLGVGPAARVGKQFLRGGAGLY